MKSWRRNWKVWLGLLISLLFLFLAFRKVDFRQMARAFAAADYWYVLPTIGVMFLSHFLRALRWKFLLEPVQTVPVGSLYSALLIGYMVNNFMPAHLGELVRAVVLGRRRAVPSSAVFATIVIERIIDVLGLLLLLALMLLIHPFPSWVKTSALILLAGILVLIGLLVMLKAKSERAAALILKICRPLSEARQQKVADLFRSFLNGLKPLRRKAHYFWVAVLSLLVYLGYVLSFQILFHGFDFIKTYSLPWDASLVLLVISTISIVVPSSPGYVGTYHYLIQLALALFAVPAGPALSFAFVMHGLNFIPQLIVGFILVLVGGMSLRSIRETRGESLQL